MIYQGSENAKRGVRRQYGAAMGKRRHFECLWEATNRRLGFSSVF
jgi:hypothetical protein